MYFLQKMFKSKEQQKRHFFFWLGQWPFLLSFAVLPDHCCCTAPGISSVLCVGEEGVMVHKMTHSEREDGRFSQTSVTLSPANYCRLWWDTSSHVFVLLHDWILTISHKICAGGQQLFLVWFIPYLFPHHNQVFFSGKFLFHLHFHAYLEKNTFFQPDVIGKGNILLFLVSSIFLQLRR